MKPTTLLFNPFKKIAGWKAFAIGMVVMIIISLITTYCQGNYFTTPANLGLVSNFTKLFTSYAITAIVFLIAGKIMAKDVRTQDILGTLALAKYPSIFSPFITRLMGAHLASRQHFELDTITTNLVMIACQAVTMLILTWGIILSYNAYRESTGLKGSKCIISFIIAFAVATVLAIVKNKLIF